MGLSIGQIPAALAGLRSSPEFGRVRLRDEGDPSSPRRTQDNEPTLGLGRREEITPRAGFGEGTLSPQGAALRTINRTVEESRRALPSLDDIRTRFQANAAEARREARESSAPVDRNESIARAPEDRPTVQRVERRIPEAAAQARRFISDINDAAAQAVERTGGEVAARPTGASIEIRGERTPIAERDERTRIDVRV
jgi:hypothetical protein